MRQPEQTPNPPITASIEGAWRLTSVMEYRAEDDRWYVPDQRYWGPKDCIFERDVVTIHTPDASDSKHYDFSHEERIIRLSKVEYFICELTPNKLVLECEGMTYSFKRIDPSEIHEKEVVTQILSDELSGLWQVDAEYERVEGQWHKRTDFRKVPGIHFWKFYDFSSWYEYDFGSSPQHHGNSYKSFNKRYGIFRRYRKKQEDDFFHPVLDSGGYWVYVLDSMTGDYRDSHRRLYLSPVDRSKKDLFMESLLWAESERHHNTPADKLPLELMRLWASVDSAKMERLILDNDLFDHPEDFRTEEFAGAYVFLHYYLISMKDSDASSMAQAYGKFHEVLNRWLSLYDDGKAVKYVYPLNFKKNLEHLEKLQQAEEATYVPFIKHRSVTCALLRERLAEIRSSDHYLYALMEGLPKEIFYLHRATEGERICDRKSYTLQEFLSDNHTLQPDDPVSLHLFLHMDDFDREIYVSNWILYSNSIDLLFEFSTENLKKMFDAFLSAYCEKCLRINKMFCLSPETIRHFGFTEEDVRELQPRLDRFNAEAMIRIRKDYEALAQLDFIRAESKIPT